jgi:CheY-like chemotaxis protein
MKMKLLLVEDEAITAMSIRKDLERMGYEVSDPIGTGEEAIRKALTEKPSVILMDINIIGDMDGIEAVEKIHDLAMIPVIYMSGYSNQAIKERAIKTGPLAYLEKPVNVREIQHILEVAGSHADGVFQDTP